jgi:hypothetical protein
VTTHPRKAAPEGDIAAIASSAEAFHASLEAAKGRIGSVDFEWYPYRSLSNISALNKILTGANRNLASLLQGRPVLDVGCADGACTFFLESLGLEVDAIDNVRTNHNKLQGFRALAAELRSAARLYTMDLDRQASLPPRRYGLALFWGLLYHLKNPFYALEDLGRRAEYCALSTRIFNISPDRTRLGHLPVAYLLDERELNSDPTNYWIFSELGLRRLLDRSGWDVLDHGVLGDERNADPVTVDTRFFCLLRSRYSPFGPHLEFLSGFHEMEEGAWRWTQRKFSILVNHEYADRPATVQLRFSIPESLVKTFGAVTLTAFVDSMPLASQTFTQAGDALYAANTPAPLLGTRARVDFEMSHAFAGLGQDQRELCVQIQDSSEKPAAVIF